MLLSDESSPPEDEGISSSERSLSPEGDLQRESKMYEVFKVNNEKYDLIRNKRGLQKKLENAKNKNEHKSSDEEDETTIDEVIQELRNIVNHAESEQYSKDIADDRSSRCNQTSEINVPVNALKYQINKEDKKDSVTSTKHNIQITNTADFSEDNLDDDEESEIVPSKIHPHPPRRAKSLLHLFVPPLEQGIIFNKPQNPYDENFYSSDEGSDSLLSASRLQNQVKTKTSASSFDFHECRAVFNSIAESKRPRTRSREDNRKTPVKRSESFQTSDIGARQREYIDNMFFNEVNSSPLSSTPQRSNSKCSRVDEIVNLIESKKLTNSLDRMDEGLNSMVDIVMLSEPKKTEWPYERRQRSCSRTNSDAEVESPLVPVTRSNTRVSNFRQTYDSRTWSSKDEPLVKSDKQQKSYLLQPKLISGVFDSQTFNSSTFLVKRGHNNGFYSGTHLLRDAPASMTTLGKNDTHGHADLKRTLSPIGSGTVGFGNHKVTDMPSGLY